MVSMAIYTRIVRDLWIGTLLDGPNRTIEKKGLAWSKGKDDGERLHTWSCSVHDYSISYGMWDWKGSNFEHISRRSLGLLQLAASVRGWGISTSTLPS
jgi:hypothetical protein